MISKWFKLKDKAIALRKSGKSLKDVERILGIPRSTLSGWFKGIQLSKKQRRALDKRWRKALVYARTKSVIWHNTEKKKRLELAEKSASESLLKIDENNMNILELALAMLYLGEGSKTGNTSIGNSDPKILLFFVKSMEKLYGFDRRKVRCNLHLRTDQDVNILKKYWSKELRIPIENFGGVSIDKRTIGKKTYRGYKGVCVLYYGNIAIQRKLVYLSRGFCERL